MISTLALASALFLQTASDKQEANRIIKTLAFQTSTLRQEYLECGMTDSVQRLMFNYYSSGMGVIKREYLHNQLSVNTELVEQIADGQCSMEKVIKYETYVERSIEDLNLFSSRF